MADLNDVMVETKKTFEQLQSAVADFKAQKTRIEAVEAKVGHVPVDLKETLGKIDVAIEKFDTKHNDLITKYQAVEQKLNDLEQAGDVVETSKKEDVAHMEEFKSFLRSGVAAYAGRKGANEAKLIEMQQKAMFAGSDPDGGFVIPRPLSAMIQTAKRDITPFRQYAGSTTVSGDMFKFLIDIGEFGSGWVTERASRGKTTTTQLQEASIAVHEMYAGPALTQNILDDAAFPIESWMAEKTAESFGDLEANAFLLGNGVGKPRGILTYAHGTTWGTIEQIASGGSTSITADQLMELQGALKEQYAAGAAFYMNRKTVTKIRQLKSNDTQYIWQPGIQAGAPSTLLGDPIVKMNYMPVSTTGANLAIAYGDMKKAYLIVDRLATRVLRDPYTATPYVIFKTNARVGGDVVDFEALKIMKIGSSL